MKSKLAVIAAIATLALVGAGCARQSAREAGPGQITAPVAPIPDNPDDAVDAIIGDLDHEDEMSAAELEDGNEVKSDDAAVGAVGKEPLDYE